MLFRIGGLIISVIPPAPQSCLAGRGGGEARATAITCVVARKTVNPVNIAIVPTLSVSLTLPIAVTSQPFSVTTLDHFFVLDFSGSFNDDIATPSKFLVLAASALLMRINRRFSRPV